MGNMKWRPLQSGTFRRTFYFILLASSFLLSISFTACGRRGDPVAVVPYENNTVEAERTAPESSGEGVSSVPEEKTPSVPDAPGGLKAVYTGTAVVLTWDEVSGKGTMVYTVYRSEERDFTALGTTQTPAFSDRTVTKGKTYYYRVSAMIDTEGEMSEGLKISTGMGEQ